MIRGLTYGLFDAPKTPFVRVEGAELREISQSPKDLEFSRSEIQKWIESKFWVNISHDRAMLAKLNGAVISSCFKF